MSTNNWSRYRSKPHQSRGQAEQRPLGGVRNSSNDRGAKRGQERLTAYEQACRDLDGNEQALSDLERQALNCSDFATNTQL